MDCYHFFTAFAKEDIKKCAGYQIQLLLKLSYDDNNGNGDNGNNNDNSDDNGNKPYDDDKN